MNLTQDQIMFVMGLAAMAIVGAFSKWIGKQFDRVESVDKLTLHLEAVKAKQAEHSVLLKEIREKLEKVVIMERELQTMWARIDEVKRDHRELLSKPPPLKGDQNGI